MNLTRYRSIMNRLNELSSVDNRCFAPRGEFVIRRVGDENVLVPIRNRVGDLDSVFVLTHVAARVWSLLDGTKDVDAVVSAICDEYDVDADVARADVVELLDSLAAADLIEART
jgi:hypothetical protein